MNAYDCGSGLVMYDDGKDSETRQVSRLFTFVIGDGIISGDVCAGEGE
jgi:hypothetical protein